MTPVGTGRVAIVTGAGSGIGAATSLLLAERGWQVAVADIDADKAGAVAGLIGENGGSAVAVGADVASARDWARLVATVRTGLGPIAALISNAAHNAIAPFEQLSLGSWQRHLDVNVTGTFLGVQACLSDLRAQAGSIVLVSSVHAAFGLPRHAAYAAGKAAIEGLARQLAAELGPRVRVNAVRPGPILTAAWSEIPEADRARTAAATLLGRLGRPEEAAEAIAFLAGERSSFVTGSVLAVDGGWSVAKDSS